MVQIRRVTKVVKGGKQLSFRAVVVVGNEKGSVGVGVSSAKEVITAVQVRYCCGAYASLMEEFGGEMARVDALSKSFGPRALRPLRPHSARSHPLQPLSIIPILRMEANASDDRHVVVLDCPNTHHNPSPLLAPAPPPFPQKAVIDAKQNLVTVPATRTGSIPHKIEGIAGAAKVMLRPAADGTGDIASGSVRVVLELAGLKNCFGKQLGSPNPLNNARATLDGLTSLRTFSEVSEDRGIPVSELMQ